MSQRFSSKIWRESFKMSTTRTGLVKMITLSLSIMVVNEAEDSLVVVATEALLDEVALIHPTKPWILRVINTTISRTLKNTNKTFSISPNKIIMEVHRLLIKLQEKRFRVKWANLKFRALKTIMIDLISKEDLAVVAWEEHLDAAGPNHTSAVEDLTIWVQEAKLMEIHKLATLKVKLVRCRMSRISSKCNSRFSPSNLYSSLRKRRFLNYRFGLGIILKLKAIWQLRK